MRRSGVGVVEYSARLGLPFGVVALVALLGGAEAGQVARNSDDDVLIGTVDLAGTSRPVAGATKPGAAHSIGAAETQPPAGPDAAIYYTNALQALETGDFLLAQQLFEKVIAADPQGPRAAGARQHLGQLYTAAQSRVSPPAPPMIAQPPGVALPPLAPDPARQNQDSMAAEGDDDGPDPPNSRVGGPRGPESAGDEQRFLIEAGDRVFFSPGSAEIGTRARAVLSAQAAWLVKRPEWNITVEGHADDPPLSEDELEDLSEARAQAVRQRLVAGGVAATRVAIVPWGRHAPISDCPDPSCQVQNRRAVIVLQPRRGPGQRELSEKSGRGKQPAGVPWAASRTDLPAR